MIREKIIHEIKDELLFQDKKWGEQNHPILNEQLLSDPTGLSMARYYGIPSEERARHLLEFNQKIGKLTYMHILIEEVCEVANCQTLENMRKELIQVAAVATAMIESIDRKQQPTLPNVIGQHITEPYLIPEQMVKGEWYIALLKNAGYWIFKFNCIIDDTVFTNETISLKELISINKYDSLSYISDFTQLRRATEEEVLKYFPDEIFPKYKEGGRWYMCVEKNEEYFIKGKWYFCPKNNPNDYLSFIDEQGKMNSMYPFNYEFFDLDNPQLINPDQTDLNFIDPATT